MFVPERIHLAQGAAVKAKKALQKPKPVKVSVCGKVGGLMERRWKWDVIQETDQRIIPPNISALYPVIVG